MIHPDHKHDRACEIIERDINYETEYAEYELSKDWERTKKRSNLSKMLTIFFVILILSGKQFDDRASINIFIFIVRTFGQRNREMGRSASISSRYNNSYNFDNNVNDD